MLNSTTIMKSSRGSPNGSSGSMAVKSDQELSLKRYTYMTMTTAVSPGAATRLNHFSATGPRVTTTQLTTSETTPKAATRAESPPYSVPASSFTMLTAERPNMMARMPDQPTQTRKLTMKISGLMPCRPNAARTRVKCSSPYLVLPSTLKTTTPTPMAFPTTMAAMPALRPRK
jgi:hypothetical protein